MLLRAWRWPYDRNDEFLKKCLEVLGLVAQPDLPSASPFMRGGSNPEPGEPRLPSLTCSHRSRGRKHQPRESRRYPPRHPLARLNPCFADVYKRLRDTIEVMTFLKRQRRGVRKRCSVNIMSILSAVKQADEQRRSSATDPRERTIVS